MNQKNEDAQAIAAECIRQSEEGCYERSLFRRAGELIQQLIAELEAVGAGGVQPLRAESGWVLVPVEPTQEMLEAAVQAICYGPGGGFTRISGPHRCWSAMLAAAPKAPQQAEQEPVAWRISCPDEPDLGTWLSEEPGGPGCHSEPLYTAPQQAAQGTVHGDALPERNNELPAEQQGLFRKFVVSRVDGSDRPGGKHHGCRYFVIDVDHDPHAPAALDAYAKACETTHPTLAADLRAKWIPPHPAPATPQKPNLRVGQVWLTRGGAVAEIKSETTSGLYPFRCVADDCYPWTVTATGRYHYKDTSCYFDLIELIFDVPQKGGN